MSVLNGKTILVGVCGGIAAYKTCSLVSKLTQNGANVHVVMTKNATEFVAPLTFETLSHNRVTVDTFDRDFPWETEHVSLAKSCDLAVVAPATANVIAKIANGICDDFLTTTLLACRCKTIVAPAMNSAMLENIATKNNIKTLEDRGMAIVYGNSGYLACGDNGSGRMAEPDVLFSVIENSFNNDYEGKTVLVTSGATRASIDPVRFLTNRSSGKMGYCIANAAYNRGANVIYIQGCTTVAQGIPQSWKVVKVNTTSELLKALQENWQYADIAIMAAAPCDYEIEPASQKIKNKTLTLQLTKAPDCAAWVGSNKANKKLVVFAAETNDCEKNSLTKLKSKNADMVVLNDVTQSGAGFDVDTNIATLISNDFTERLELMSKSRLADVILDKIKTL